MKKIVLIALLISVCASAETKPDPKAEAWEIEYRVVQKRIFKDITLGNVDVGSRLKNNKALTSLNKRAEALFGVPSSCFTAAAWLREAYSAAVQLYSSNAHSTHIGMLAQNAFSAGEEFSACRDRIYPPIDKSKLRDTL